MAWRRSSADRFFCLFSRCDAVTCSEQAIHFRPSGREGSTHTAISELVSGSSDMSLNMKFVCSVFGACFEPRLYSRLVRGVRGLGWVFKTQAQERPQSWEQGALAERRFVPLSHGSVLGRQHLDIDRLSVSRYGGDSCLDLFFCRLSALRSSGIDDGTDGGCEVPGRFIISIDAH